MKTCRQGVVQVYKLKAFARFQRRERITDKMLGKAVADAERGLVDADLGGGLIKHAPQGRDKARAAATAQLSPIGAARGLYSCSDSRRASGPTSMTMSWLLGGGSAEAISRWMTNCWMRRLRLTNWWR